MSTFATLKMPATWSEYQDAKDQLRITNDRDITSYELSCKYEWLSPHIPENADLGELNLLAGLLEKSSKDDLDIFEAMVKIDAGRSRRKEISLPRLINLTFSTDNCHVAGGVSNDTQLGRFLFENDMLPEEVRSFAVLQVFWGAETEDQRFGLIGARHRETEGSMFTGSGRYVDFDGCVNERYVSGEMTYFERSIAPVVLKISKGGIYDPDADNGLAATLFLPEVHGSEITQALQAVKASSAEEAGYFCADCVIPAAKEWINAAQDLEQVREFAKALDQIESQSSAKEYKALLEAAACDNLDDALRLSEQIGEYRLAAHCPGPEAYAREALGKSPFAEISEEICRHTNLYGLGLALMEQSNIKDTSYGLLSRKDGGPVFSQSDQPAAGMEMR
jgi:hypothetical protein